MKQLACVMLAVLLCGSMYAQSGNASNAKTQTNKYVDQTSVDILDAIYKKMTAYSNVYVQFTFRTEKGGTTLDEMKGSIYVKGNQYKLITKEQQVYCDAHNVWTYMPEQKEVSIAPFDSTDTEQLNPLQMVKDYKKNYRSNFIRDENRRGVWVQIIDLIPKKASSIAKVRLVSDKAKKQIVNVVVYEKDGTMYNYLVDKFLVNQSLPANAFTFNTANYPDVDVIDMR